MTSRQRTRILFLAANPQSTSPLDLEEELRGVEAELRGVAHRDELEIIAAHAVRPDDLVRLLRRHQPAVVHFSGHGSPDGVILRAEHGHVAVPGRALARVLSDRGVKLVVLNACYSDQQADDMTLAVPVVVGTTAAVGDKAARRFSVAFYRTLGDGFTVGEAFRDGGDAVELHTHDDVFHLRGDGELVLFGVEADHELKTTPQLVTAIGRLSATDRKVLRAILKASSDIDTKAFREFFRAPNVISGNTRDGYRFKLIETLGIEPHEVASSTGKLQRLGLVVRQELTDHLFEPSPPVVAIVNRSSDVILSLLYTSSERDAVPIEEFNGTTRYRDGKPDYYLDRDGVPLQGDHLLAPGERKFFIDGRIADRTD